VERKRPPSALLPIIKSVADAQVSPPPLKDRQGHPVIIPQPKLVSFTAADYLLRGSLPVTAIRLWGEDGRRVQEELERLTTLLRREAGIRIRRRSGDWRGRGLLVMIGGRKSPQRRATTLTGQELKLPEAPDQAEGYALRVTPQSIEIVGSDAAGAYYGLQTLRQLLLRDAGGRSRFVGVNITDWPSLRFRGAHIFVGREALPFHKKLIERIFSRYKLNKIVIECEYTAWRSHPEIHVAYSMPPGDLKAEVAYARDHFMEPIPLVNSLGHCRWIFANGRHRDIVEDPRVPYAYNASNPDTYKFLFDIYRETLDIFHPRLFHIGHDEVKIPGTDQFGKYPARPENQKKGITRLFVDDTNRLADWLRPRGARAMLWADMLLHESEGVSLPGVPILTAANATSLAEAQARRAQLPGDAIVTDWRYGAGSEQRNGLAVLKQAGFNTVGCAWYEPENIRGWAAEAIRNGAWGTLQTTWAGYNSNEGLLKTEYNQFSAYVLAAEYAWSGSPLHPDTGKRAKGRGKSRATTIGSCLPYTAENVFARSYRNLTAGGRPQHGWLLLPGNAANIRLQSAAQESMPSAASASQYSVSTMPGLHTTHNADTGLIVPSKPTSGIMPGSALSRSSSAAGKAPPARPAAISLSIHRRAHTLGILHAAAYGVAAKTLVGTYTVVYEDGKRTAIPLRYGFEIRALDDQTPSNSIALSTIKAGADSSLTLRLLQWSNPRPNVAIARLEFRADNPLTAPILFAITGIQ
jgi:hypothetical protein